MHLKGAPCSMAVQVPQCCRFYRVFDVYTYQTACAICAFGMLLALSGGMAIIPLHFQAMQLRVARLCVKGGGAVALK